MIDFTFDVLRFLVTILYFLPCFYQEKSAIMHVGGAVYFFFSIMVGAFVFANLVVAVVVTNLVSQKHLLVFALLLYWAYEYHQCVYHDFYTSKEKHHFTLSLLQRF